MTLLSKSIAVATCTATVAAVVGAGIYESRQAGQLAAQMQSLRQQQAPLAAQVAQLQSERDAAANRLAEFLANGAKDNGSDTELLRLRGEVTMLRQNSVMLSNQLARSSNHYGLLAEQMPPVISSSIFETARSYARLVQKLADGQLSTPEEFNLVKAWPYLEKRFSEPDNFAFFQSEYLAVLWSITNRDTVWGVRRVLETARDEEHLHGLAWARKSDQELQQGGPNKKNMEKIRDRWNVISERTSQQIKDLLPADQQANLAAFPGPVLDFDPRLKSGTGASASDARFQNLDSQAVFEAFTAASPNVRFVPVTRSKGL